jgi:hypothetical protein
MFAVQDLLVCAIRVAKSEKLVGHERKAGETGRMIIVDMSISKEIRPGRQIPIDI